MKVFVAGATVLLSAAVAGVAEESGKSCLPQRSGPACKETDAAVTTADATEGDLAGATLFGSAAIIFDAAAPITDRFRAVSRLRSDLDTNQIAALYKFLSNPILPFETNVPGLHALKNEIVCRLQDQTHPAWGLTTTLIGIYRDRRQDDVTRDYALQHLVTWCEQGAADAQEAKARIRDVLREALTENSSISATALLGLHRLTPHEGDGAENEIGISALKLLRSGQSAASTATAIQVCAEREVSEALPVLREIAWDNRTLALRVSAIAALGRLGGPPEIAVLQQIEEEKEKAVEPSVTAALRRLRAKISRMPAFTQNSL